MNFTPAGSYFVYPTRGDAASGVGVGVVPYKGSYHSELQLGPSLSALAVANYVVSGFLVPGSSASLVLAIPLGVAMIDGRVVSISGSTNVTCTASGTNYGFLKLEKDADGFVLSAAIEVNITGVAPADSVPLFTAVTGVSTVTSTVDVRPTGAPRGRRCRMAVYSVAGTYSFVPEFTGPHTVLLIGGGGSGGAGRGRINTTTDYASGGGGGSGAATFGQVDLTAGVPAELVVGAGGLATANLYATRDGEASTFGPLAAAGGQGADRANPTTGTPGGAGGAASPFSASSFSLAGSAGTAGLDATGAVNKAGGNGGDSPFWKGLLGGLGVDTGNNSASGAGAGGSGGRGRYASGIGTGLSVFNAPGGGADGLVIVYW